MNKWIKSSDALPLAVEYGVSEPVLVIFAGLACPYDIANYDHDAKHWSLPNQSYAHPDCDPSHWMPIPAVVEAV